MAEQNQKPKWHVSQKQRSDARALRCDMTVAERIIWYNARAHRFRGTSFRRQTPIGPIVGVSFFRGRSWLSKWIAAHLLKAVIFAGGLRRAAFLAPLCFLFLLF